MNKTAASVTQLTKCTFLHAYSRTTASSSCMRTNKNFIAYLASWHNSIYGYKLRTD